MESYWTDLVDSIVTDNPSDLTSDVLLGEVEGIEPERSMMFHISNFSRWPVLIENVASVEDADLLEMAISQEKSVREPKTIFVTLSSPEKLGRSFAYIAVPTSIPPYISIEDRFGPSPRQTSFSPDFSTIKRVMAHVMGQTLTSLLQQQQPCKVLKKIPITISPQLVREAEEGSLTDDLESSIKLAQETYSTLKRIDVNLEHDPEIADRKTIRFAFTVSGKPDTILENEASFKRCLRSNIDACTRELITVTYNWEE